MQTRTIFLAILTLLGGFLHSQTKWKKVSLPNGESVGYASTNDTLALSPTPFKRCYSSSFDSLALVLSDSGVIAIDKSAKPVYKVMDEDSLSFDIFRIISNHKYGYARLNGEVICPPKFDKALPFNDGLAFVNQKSNLSTQHIHQWKDGKWGAINMQGKIVIPIQFTDVNFQSKQGTFIQTSKK